jgi:O-antigen ligase
MGDENDLALACDVALPFAYLGVFRFRGVKRVLCMAAAILLVGGAVASFSRGGFLGLAAGLGYCVLVGRNRIRNLAIAGVVGIAFLVAVPREYVAELGTIGETESGTAENRFFLWTAATMMWRDHPVFGVGPGNSKFLLGDYNPKPQAGGMFGGAYYTDRVWSMRAIHSLYFELLAERGIVGVALFGAMAIGHYRTLRDLRRRVSRRDLARSSLARDAEFYARSLEASMTAFLVAGAFLSMLNYPYFWFFCALSVALTRSVQHAWLGLAARRRAAAGGLDGIFRPGRVPA